VGNDYHTCEKKYHFEKPRPATTERTDAEMGVKKREDKA
jgi:hypothetical protein